MDELFNFTITAEGLTEEIEEEFAKIRLQTHSAMNDIAVELNDNLQKHLQQDWYEKYEPTVYQRRTDNPSLGTPLGSETHIFIEYEMSDNANTLTFTYEPTGEHENSDWLLRDGDDLITSIQTGNLWGNPPPRPFWNNFVNEMQNNGIMDAFITGMKPYSVIREKEDNIDLSDSLLFENDEGNLPY